MASPVEQIKNKLLITDVIGSYIKLERAGSRLKAKCPFHNEKTASFFLSPDRGTYYCFGCGAKGDIFTFVEHFEGTDFAGALKLLAERAGVEIVREPSHVRTERDKLYEIMEIATDYYESMLSKGKDVVGYLKERGLSQTSIENWRLGYAPREWRELYGHLTGKGFQETEIEKAGLIKQGEERKNWYDRFRGRIIFPIFDSSGRVIAFSGRIFGGDSEAKYLNSPETPIFYKSKILYGLNRAKEGIHKYGFSILVEGQIDLVMSHQAGFTNTVATSGTSFSEDHVNLLYRISPNIVIAYDGDEAGIKAAVRTSRLALARGMEVKVAEFPLDKDPADMVKDDKQSYKNVIKGAKPIVEYYLNVIKKQSKDDRAIARRVINELLPIVSSMESAVMQSQSASYISNITGIKEEAIWDDIKNISKGDVFNEGSVNNNMNDSPLKEKSPVRVDMLERKAAGIIFWQEHKNKSPDWREKLISRWNEIAGKGRVDEILNTLKNDEKELLIFEAEAYYDGAENIEKEVLDLNRELEIEYLKREFQNIVKEMQGVEQIKDNPKILSLLKRSRDISQRIEKLKKN